MSVPDTDLQKFADLITGMLGRPIDREVSDLCFSTAWVDYAATHGQLTAKDALLQKATEMLRRSDGLFRKIEADSRVDYNLRQDVGYIIAELAALLREMG